MVGEPSKASSSVGGSGSRGGCVKQLRLAIFTPSLSRTPPHADYSVRVYALEDNMAALEVRFAESVNKITNITLHIENNCLG